MTDTAARPRGRPKDPRKLAAVLDAARATFLEHGVDAMALDTVIARAGVSKATFYAHFSDRDALLEAVIRRESSRIVPVDPDRPDGDGDLVEDLVGFGVRLLRLLTDPDIVGFERLIATAARSHPDLAERFYQAGPGRAFDALTRRLAAGVGALTLDDPRLAAEDLVGLWQGMLRVEQTMRLAPPPTDAELVARARRGVATFMRLHGTDPTQSFTERNRLL